MSSIIKTFSITQDLVDWLATQKNQSKVVRKALEEYKKKNDPHPEPDAISLLKQVLDEIRDLKEQGVTVTPEVEHIVEKANGEADNLLLEAFGK